MSGYPKPYAESTLKTKYKQLGLPAETVELLHSYFSAFANFYGILTLKDAYNIIIKQNPELLTFDKLYEFTEIVKREKQYYYIVDADEMRSNALSTPETREIVAEDLLSVDDDAYYELFEAQSDKPLYIPKKDELLRYEDEFYYEKTPSSDAVEKFFIKRKKITGEDLLDVMADIICSYNISDNPIEEAFDSLEWMEIELTDDEVETLGELLCKLNNNFRTRFNRGYTPNELSKILKKSTEPPIITFGENIKQMIKSGEISVSDLQNDIIESDNYPPQIKLELLAQLAEINGVKIQPESIPKNAPCPCGSGKKYKRCCGKDIVM